MKSSRKLCYICLKGEVFARLSDKLHRQILQRKTALQRFANRDLFVLQVTLELNRPPDVFGYIYHFDSKGFFDPSAALSALEQAMMLPAAKASGSVLDISNLLASRRWRNENIWTPSADLANFALQDAVRTKGKVPLLEADLIK